MDEVAAVTVGTAGGDDGGASGRPPPKVQPGHRSYNLQERRRIGSMTGTEQALLPRVPTDESEAQTLATADLDLMKSECPPWTWGRGQGRGGLSLCSPPPPGHRFEDVPGVRRHLVRKNAKAAAQGAREGSTPGPTPRTRLRAPHKPHEVLMLLFHTSPGPLLPPLTPETPSSPQRLDRCALHEGALFTCSPLGLGLGVVGAPSLVLPPGHV